jgi:predicted methyltransferase
MKTSMPYVILALMLTACGPESPHTVVDEHEPHSADGAIYADAVANPARNDADRERDAGRKPAQVLDFMRIEPGMTILDLFSGGCYYSEILSYVVGENGSVVAHSNEAYLTFVGDEFNARHADGRLPNVEVLMAENNELELSADQFDAIFLILAYHDIFYVAPQQGWPKIDGEKLLAELFKGLKPGGIVGIVDHFAEAGAPRETGGTVHRIDPGIVIADMLAAGFKLDAKSDLLRNMNDDYSKIVFDPELRGKTDRFVLRFVKPE